MDFPGLLTGLFRNTIHNIWIGIKNKSEFDYAWLSFLGIDLEAGSFFCDSDFWDPDVEDPDVEDPAVEDPDVEDPDFWDPDVEDSSLSFLLRLRPTLSKPIRAGRDSIFFICVLQSSQRISIFPISLTECCTSLTLPHVEHS